MKEKQYYYFGKNYFGAPYKEIYTKKSRFLKVYYTLSGDAYFNFNKKRYKIDDFSYTYDNEIIDDSGNVITLTAMQRDVYYKPLCIEYDETGDAVRVYQYDRTENI